MTSAKQGKRAKFHCAWHLEVRGKVERGLWQPTGREWFWSKADAEKHYYDELQNFDDINEYQVRKYIPEIGPRRARRKGKK